MSKLAALTGKEVVSLLKKDGFVMQRQKGSHVFLRHPDGRATVIPIHAGETIASGLLSKILKDVDMTKDDFMDLLKG